MWQGITLPIFFSSEILLETGQRLIKISEKRVRKSQEHTLFFH